MIRSMCLTAALMLAVASPAFAQTASPAPAAMKHDAMKGSAMKHDAMKAAPAASPTP